MEPLVTSPSPGFTRPVWSPIVVSTSVGPSEDFFKAGFGKYCDAYDFHVYGDSAEVRDIIENRYPALFAKYGDKKPIWSTELGLNSHGMARLPVATELVCEPLIGLRKYPALTSATMKTTRMMVTSNRIMTSVRLPTALSRSCYTTLRDSRSDRDGMRIQKSE